MPTRAKCGSEEKLNLRAGQDYVNLLWYSYHIKAKFLNILLSSRWLCARLLRTAQILQEYRKHLKASAFLSPFPLYSTILYALHISQGSQTWPTAIADNQCVSSERKTLPDFLHFWDIWKGQHFFYFFIWKKKKLTFQHFQLQPDPPLVIMACLYPPHSRTKPKEDSSGNSTPPTVKPGNSQPLVKQ